MDMKLFAGHRLSLMGRLCHYGTLIRGHPYWQYYYFQLKFDYIASHDPTTCTPTTSASKPTNICGADHPSGSMGHLSFPIDTIVQRPLREPALWGSNSIFFLHLSHAQALYGNPTRSPAEGVERRRRRGPSRCVFWISGW